MTCSSLQTKGLPGLSTCASLACGALCQACLQNALGSALPQQSCSPYKQPLCLQLLQRLWAKILLQHLGAEAGHLKPAEKCLRAAALLAGQCHADMDTDCGALCARPTVPLCMQTLAAGMRVSEETSFPAGPVLRAAVLDSAKGTGRQAASRVSERLKLLLKTIPQSCQIWLYYCCNEQLQSSFSFVSQEYDSLAPCEVESRDPDLASLHSAAAAAVAA